MATIARTYACVWFEGGLELVLNVCRPFSFLVDTAVLIF